jgi:hypothetical protein
MSGTTNDIPPLAPPLPELARTWWEQWGVSTLIAMAVLLAAAGFLLWLRLRPRPAPPVPPEAAARRHLIALAALDEDGTVLSRISQTLRRYASAAAGLTPGELTTAELCAAVRSHERIGPELHEALYRFLHDCDERKFSPIAASEPTGAAQRALELVDAIHARTGSRPPA